MKKYRVRTHPFVRNADKHSHVIGLRTGMLVELVTLRFAQKRAGQTMRLSYAYAKTWVNNFVKPQRRRELQGLDGLLLHYINIHVIIIT